jgi:hypothetical protein
MFGDFADADDFQEAHVMSMSVEEIESLATQDIS